MNKYLLLGVLVLGIMISGGFLVFKEEIRKQESEKVAEEPLIGFEDVSDGNSLSIKMYSSSGKVTYLNDIRDPQIRVPIIKGHTAQFASNIKAWGYRYRPDNYQNDYSFAGFLQDKTNVENIKNYLKTWESREEPIDYKILVSKENFVVKMKYRSDNQFACVDNVFNNIGRTNPIPMIILKDDNFTSRTDCSGNPFKDN